MRYKLKRNSKGMITQCETNADGGNIYARREEINKQALENLARPTPGKLGGLANLQIFNFSITDFATGTSSAVRKEYNTTSTFPANATQTIMFGVSGSSNKALYYNIVGVKADIFLATNPSTAIFINDSYIEFYTLQNSSGTSSLGTKIPQPAPLSGNGGGVVTFTTSGNESGAQSFGVDFVGTTINNFNNKGLRASGLALKTIFIKADGSITLSDLEIRVQVFVDITSVSSTY